MITSQDYRLKYNKKNSSKIVSYTMTSKILRMKPKAFEIHHSSMSADSNECYSVRYSTVTHRGHQCQCSASKRFIEVINMIIAV